MSGPAVVIGRFSATLHDDGSVEAGRDALGEPLRRVVDGGLERALRDVRLPPGHWCVRRLRLSVPLDPARSGPALGQDWAAAVAAAIERTVREGRGEVVHYRNDVELLAEVVAGVAAGRLGRLWAWQQAGVVRTGDPAPTVEPRAAVLAVLGRAPQHVAAAVLRAAVEGGLPSLERLFGEEGWQAVAALAAVASWCGPGPVGSGPGAAAPAAAPVGGLARTLLAGSVLVRLARSARLRPGPGTLAAWAVLAAAEADPGSLHRRPHPGLPQALAAELGAVLGLEARPSAVAPTAAEPVTFEEAESPEAETARRPPGEAATVEPQEGSDADPLAELPLDEGDFEEEPQAVPADDRTGIGTAWAGLLFLLATAPEAGLPQRALDDPALGARPLRWVLYRIGRELLPEAPPADPALLALAGLGADRADTLLAAGPPTHAERARVRELADRWAEVTAERLAPAGDPADHRAAVRQLARRTGEVCAEPGWIEVRLPVAETDLTARRAGLDLDPGWVPWLGAVVRYVYE
ncbi:hypothetical protein [Streptomyces sp. NRRL WC-3742]|uniref:hypothetical protein n=1 Tax=Streptomyces sp. NRRL WC-3742 TaxID=1463934 RepID=UPI00131E4FCB|nr:hypothetical protein [Streptomyces sp. NRRL WC-3742]